MPGSANRPGGVTFVAVLTWISGVLSIIGGIALILVRDNVDVQRELLAGSTSQTLVTIGVVYLIVGLVTIAVANGLLRGSRFSRLVVTVLMVAQIAAGFWTVANLGAQAVAAWVSITIAVVVIRALWGGRAGVFFRST